MEYDAVLWGIGSLFILSLGLVMGSFCNAFAWRLVRQQSILQGRSRCAACGHVLSAKELIPVVSWLMQKGALPSLRRSYILAISFGRGFDSRHILFVSSMLYQLAATAAVFVLKLLVVIDCFGRL